MTDAIKTILQPEVKDLGGFQVRRSLPSDEQKMVGPFIFFDHPGPAQFAPGQGVDVRPHPHINLATVTYLFEGALLHRDSLGYVQEIHPGAVNWMTAGKGISHSERTPEAERAAGHTLHGIQTWVALPDDAEEIEPSFHHHPAAEIPTWEVDGVKVTLIAGEAYGQMSPVKALSPILYLDIQFPQGGTFVLNAEYSERAVYPLTDGIIVAGTTLEPYRMAILHPGQSVDITAGAAGHCMVAGGEPLGDRHKWWNFVSSRPERIEQAKQDWRAGNFEPVPGETEFIPLPDLG
jgi:redox-sensitive bicupin YhaK (pirin superfamily)